MQDSRPLYIRIYQDLKEKIESGEYVTDEQLPTEIELAELHGVSRITSKRALIELEREGLIYRKRGSGSYVKRIGDRSAQSVPGGQIISIILPYVAGNGSFGHVQGATDFLDSKGYYLSIHSSNWDKMRERDFLYQLPRRGVSGILLYPFSSAENINGVFSMYIHQHPIVTIDQCYDTLPIGSVASDNFKGGWLAASRLIELGHKRIAFVSSIHIQYRSSVRDRFYGYCKALREAGIPLDPDIIVHDMLDKYETPNRSEHLQALIDRLLDKGVTAIQAEHDHMAVDIMQAAAERNVRVPSDLSIVGFDNHEISAKIEVPLSTISQNFYEIGKRAASLLVEQIERGSMHEQKKIEVDVEWVGRQSTGPAR